MLPFTGWAADRFDRRRLLIVTQAVMCALALSLGLLTVLGHVQLWQVYGFAFLLGCVSAFDAPARHSFVSDLVGDRDVGNAVALNSASFNAARMVGPAVAGVTIAAVGSGWTFLLNAASFIAVLAALRALKLPPRKVVTASQGQKTGLLDGFRYVWQRRDLRTYMAMLLLIATFGLNFPIYISTMAVTVFHADASGYGLLTSFMAFGSIAGALLAASKGKTGSGQLILGAGAFGVGCLLAALAPSYLTFGVLLALIGVAAQIFTVATKTVVQLTTDPGMRGRVLAILLAITLGSTPFGAPMVGWIADQFSPRLALAVAAFAGLVAAAMGALYRLQEQRGQPAKQLDARPVMSSTAGSGS